MNLGRETDSSCELPREDQICKEVTYNAGQLLNVLYNNVTAHQRQHLEPGRRGKPCIELWVTQWRKPETQLKYYQDHYIVLSKEY